MYGENPIQLKVGWPDAPFSLFVLSYHLFLLRCRNDNIVRQIKQANFVLEFTPICEKIHFLKEN
jgi:hypothetical protein